MDRDIIFAGLNPEQRRAVEAVRGPVCILAGRRLGQDDDDHAPDREPGRDRASSSRTQILRGHVHGQGGDRDARAARAARRRRRHCAHVPLGGARASSTGSAIRPTGSWPPRRCCFAQLGNTLPPPFKFRPAGDLATEIEWAKNRRLTPEHLPRRLGDHVPPIPPDLMFRIFRGYEAEKARARLRRLRGPARADDPALRRAAGGARGGSRALPRVHRRRVPGRQPPCSRRCSTAGSATATSCARSATTTSRSTRSPARRPITCSGCRQRFPNTTVSGSRTTTARRPRCSRWRTGSFRLSAVRRRSCAPTLRPGPAPITQSFPQREARDRVRRRARAGAAQARASPLEEIADPLPHQRAAGRLRGAVARGEDPVPGCVAARTRGGAPAAARLRAWSRPRSPQPCVRYAKEAGWRERPPEKLGEREMVRQADLGRLFAWPRTSTTASGRRATSSPTWKRGSARPARTGAASTCSRCTARRVSSSSGLHPAPRGEGAADQAGEEAAREIAEERRLFYVGLTRAKRSLALTGAEKPSRFLAELGISAARPARAAEPTDPLYAALKRWRLQRATADDLPAYVVFHNSTLAEIAGRRPRDLSELASCRVSGPRSSSATAATS